MFWDVRKLKAAYMVAEGLPSSEIAVRLGINAKTIKGWREKQKFRGKVSEILSKEETRLKQAIGGV